MARSSSHRVKTIAHLAEKVGKMGDSPTARGLQAEINRLRAGAEALDNVNANRSPVDTEAAHALKVAQLARQLDKQITTVINRSGEIMRDGLANLQGKIDAKIDLKPDAFAAEIRTAFRGLNATEKGDMIAALVKENRGPELAAIVKAPSVLTGITDEQKARYEEAIIATHAAPELEARATLSDAFDIVAAASSSASNLVKDLTDPHKLAEIERGDASAREAAAIFTQSLQ
jgi:uncharacterized phage infection (PIP) family protein YhgE